MNTEAAQTFGRNLTAMVTPFHDDGSLDLVSAKRVARHLINLGHDGLVLSGTTGESPTTHGPEKIALIEAVREEVGPSIRLVAGACSNDTAHAMRMAEQARDAGADALLAVTPYYNRPSQEGIFQHITAIGNAGQLPVMVYDIPGRTAVALEDDTIDRLAQTPFVKAVKDATGQVERGMERSRRSGLAFYSGDDAVNLDWLSQGATGVVSVVGHICGARWAQLIAAVDAGDMQRAQEINAQTMPAVETIMSGGIGAVKVKGALQLIGVLENRAVRLPMVPATEEEMSQIQAALEQSGLADRVATAGELR